MRRIKHIHFVGIGGGDVWYRRGSKNQGYVLVQTSKPQNHQRNSKAMASKFILGIQLKIFKNANVLVVSTAIDPENPEIKAIAIEQRTPIVRRAEMLGELMRYRHGIAVAGTHGKTTTTSLLTTMLAEENLDPTYVIGGLLNTQVSMPHWAKAVLSWREADESGCIILCIATDGCDRDQY